MTRIALVAALVLGVASTAQAVTISTLTVDGLAFTLDREPAGSDLDPSDGVDDTFTFLLSLDTTGYTGASTDYIKNVYLQVTGGSNEDAGALTGTTAPGTWSFAFEGLNNAGCDGPSGGGFCSESADNLALLNGTPYSWTFDIDIEGSFITPHLKSQWFSTNGDKVNQISTDMIPTTGGATTGGGTTGGTTGGVVPEPASLLLLGSGLAAAALRMRRRRE